MKTAPVSLRIGGFSAEGGLDLCDVDLAHGHHRVELALGRGLVGTGRRLEQHARRDLPRIAPFILAPAALAFLSAVADNGVPVAVGLFLVLGDDHEADGLVGLEIWTAVEPDERLAEQRE